MIGETFDAPDGDPAKRGTIAAETTIRSQKAAEELEPRRPEEGGLVIAQPGDVAAFYASERERREARDALMDHRHRR